LSKLVEQDIFRGGKTQTHPAGFRAEDGKGQPGRKKGTQVSNGGECGRAEKATERVLLLYNQGSVSVSGKYRERGNRKPEGRGGGEKKRAPCPRTGGGEVQKAGASRIKKMNWQQKSNVIRKKKQRQKKGEGTPPSFYGKKGGQGGKQDSDGRRLSVATKTKEERR